MHFVDSPQKDAERDEGEDVDEALNFGDFLRRCGPLRSSFAPTRSVIHSSRFVSTELSARCAQKSMKKVVKDEEESEEGDCASKIRRDVRPKRVAGHRVISTDHSAESHRTREGERPKRLGPV